MKNSEKFKTAEERAKAFEKFCNVHDKCDCTECPLSEIKPDCGQSRGQFAWLDLEFEVEEPMPCPLCGARMGVHGSLLKCTACGLCFIYGLTTNEVINAFNMVARATMDSGKNGVEE